MEPSRLTKQIVKFFKTPSKTKTEIKKLISALKEYLYAASITQAEKKRAHSKIMKPV